MKGGLKKNSKMENKSMGISSSTSSEQNLKKSQMQLEEENRLLRQELLKLNLGSQPTFQYQLIVQMIELNQSIQELKETLKNGVNAIGNLLQSDEEDEEDSDGEEADEKPEKDEDEEPEDDKESEPEEDKEIQQIKNKLKKLKK